MFSKPKISVLGRRMRRYLAPALCVFMALIFGVHSLSTAAQEPAASPSPHANQSSPAPLHPLIHRNRKLIVCQKSASKTESGEWLRKAFRPWLQKIERTKRELAAATLKPKKAQHLKSVLTSLQTKRRNFNRLCRKSVVSNLGLIEGQEICKEADLDKDSEIGFEDLSLLLKALRRKDPRYFDTHINIVLSCWGKIEPARSSQSSSEIAVTPTLTVSPTATLGPLGPTITPTGAATAAPAITSTPAPSATATAARTPSATPTATRSPTATRTGTATPSRTPTAAPTATRSATATPTRSAIATFTRTPSPTYTATAAATLTYTPSVTATRTATVTATPAATQTAPATPTCTNNVFLQVARPPLVNPSLTEVLAAVSEEALRKDVSTLTESCNQGRAANTPGNARARAYITQAFQSIGLLPGGSGGASYYQDVPAAANGPATNILGVIPGADPLLANEAVVIGAHYDGRMAYEPRYQGADDNASGVAGVIELAWALSQLKTQLKRTIVLAAWDKEETGITGSTYYVRGIWSTPPATPTNPPYRPYYNVIYYLNLDMIGWRSRNTCDPDGTDADGRDYYDTDHDDKANCVFAMFWWLAHQTADESLLKSIASKYASALYLNTKANRGGSDHAPFGSITNSIHTIFFHTGIGKTPAPGYTPPPGEPGPRVYHTLNDTVHWLDFPGMAIITKIVLEMAWNLSRNGIPAAAPSALSRPMAPQPTLPAYELYLDHGEKP